MSLPMPSLFVFCCIFIMLASSLFQWSFCISPCGFITGGQGGNTTICFAVCAWTEWQMHRWAYWVWKKWWPVSQMPNSRNDCSAWSQLTERSICKMINLPNDPLIEFAKMSHWLKPSFKVQWNKYFIIRIIFLLTQVNKNIKVMFWGICKNILNIIIKSS